MSEPIVYIDSSEIREGKLEALKAAIDELGESLHEQLRKKAELLGQARVGLHRRLAGFARFDAP